MVRSVGPAAMAVVVWAAVGLGAAPDFTQDVVPILSKYCTGCHGSEEPEGKLALDRYDLLRKGGRRGAVIVPGKSSHSPLVLAMLGKREPKMPPPDNPAPTPAEIQVLADWIDGGAKGPAVDGTPPPIEVPRIQPSVAPIVGVHALAFSPKGDLLVVAMGDAAVLVDPATGYIVRRLDPDSPSAEAMGRTVTTVEFAPDGARVVVGGGSPGSVGQAWLHAAADGKLLGRFEGHKDCLYAARLAPDGMLLASAGYDKQIILWDVHTGRQLRVLAGHNEPVYDLGFRGDGKVLASASGDRTVKLWDVASGQRLDTLGEPLKELYSVAFSPDGKHLIAGGVDNRIRLWQITPAAKEGTNPILHSRFAHEGPVLRLAYSADGKSLASSAEDRRVKIWDAQRLAERLVLERQPEWPAALAFSPDGKRLAVGRHDGSVALYDAATGARQKAFEPAPPPPAKPELASVEPRGIERGKPAKVLIRGKHLDGAASLRFDHPGISGRILANPAPTASEVWFELAAQPNVPRGRYQVTVTTAGGTSGALGLEVDDLHQLVESEPNDDAARSTPLALPASAWGTLTKPGDIDYFGFEAKKGQTIVFDLSASGMNSKLDGVLDLYDAQGRLVAHANDFDEKVDPLLAWTAPADGRYVLRVSDLVYNGSAEHFYRLSAGEFAFVTGSDPLGVPTQAESEVALVGHNVRDHATVRVKAGSPGELRVPLDRERFRFRRDLMLAVGELPEVREREPNDQPAGATPLAIPGTANGVFTRAVDSGPPDVDLFRFKARAGQGWIIETESARRGSLADTKIEVLDAQGQPVGRVWFQATRDSYVEFRNINAAQIDVRVKNWEEMELNEYLYISGEVCKIFRLPQGPDSGFQLYGVAGKRVCYFDTTATTHALGDPIYTVEPLAPGSELIPNGLPVVRLPFANDDSADRKLGSDSRLTFRPPADGDYLIRVTDVEGQGGDRHAYRLTVRAPEPDFRLRIGGANPAIGRGSGQTITFSADRLDGFDGPIAVEVSGLPAGISISQPIVIEAGHWDAKAALSAAVDAPSPSKEDAARTRVTASAEITGKKVVREIGGLGTIGLAAPPKVLVRLEPARIRIAPGATVPAQLLVERHGFEERIEFDVANLPHGVVVDNIGLNGILIPEGQSARTIYLTARKWVRATERPFFAVSRAAGNPASGSVLLCVEEDDPLAAKGSSE